MKYNLGYQMKNKKSLFTKNSFPLAVNNLLENQIGELVYKLYNLTNAKVKIIDPDICLSEEKYMKTNLSSVK